MVNKSATWAGTPSKIPRAASRKKKNTSDSDAARSYRCVDASNASPRDDGDHARALASEGDRGASTMAKRPEPLSAMVSRRGSSGGVAGKVRAGRGRRPSVCAPSQGPLGGARSLGVGGIRVGGRTVVGAAGRANTNPPALSASNRQADTGACGSDKGEETHPPSGENTSTASSGAPSNAVRILDEGEKRDRSKHRFRRPESNQRRWGYWASDDNSSSSSDSSEGARSTSASPFDDGRCDNEHVCDAWLSFQDDSPLPERGGLGTHEDGGGGFGRDTAPPLLSSPPSSDGGTPKHPASSKHSIFSPSAAAPRRGISSWEQVVVSPMGIRPVPPEIVTTDRRGNRRTLAGSLANRTAEECAYLRSVGIEDFESTDSFVGGPWTPRRTTSEAVRTAIIEAESSSPLGTEYVYNPLPAFAVDAAAAAAAAAATAAVAADLRHQLAAERGNCKSDVQEGDVAQHRSRASRISTVNDFPDEDTRDAANRYLSAGGTGVSRHGAWGAGCRGQFTGWVRARSCDDSSEDSSEESSGEPSCWNFSRRGASGIWRDDGGTSLGTPGRTLPLSRLCSLSRSQGSRRSNGSRPARKAFVESYEDAFTAKNASKVAAGGGKNARASGGLFALDGWEAYLGCVDAPSSPLSSSPPCGART